MRCKQTCCSLVAVNEAPTQKLHCFLFLVLWGIKDFRWSSADTEAVAASWEKVIKSKYVVWSFIKAAEICLCTQLQMCQCRREGGGINTLLHLLLVFSFFFCRRCTVNYNRKPWVFLKSAEYFWRVRMGKVPMKDGHAGFPIRPMRVLSVM